MFLFEGQVYYWCQWVFSFPAITAVWVAQHNNKTDKLFLKLFIDWSIFLIGFHFKSMSYRICYPRSSNHCLISTLNINTPIFLVFVMPILLPVCRFMMDSWPFSPKKPVFLDLVCLDFIVGVVLVVFPVHFFPGSSPPKFSHWLGLNIHHCTLEATKTVQLIIIIVQMLVAAILYRAFLMWCCI